MRQYILRLQELKKLLAEQRIDLPQYIALQNLAMVEDLQEEFGKENVTFEKLRELYLKQVKP